MSNTKKIIIALILFITILGTSFLFFRFEEKDTEWVNDINDLIEDKKPFPEEPYPPMAMYQFYYNGSLIYQTSNSSNDFVVEISDVINRAYWIINSSESRKLLEEVLESSTYLQVLFRFEKHFRIQSNVVNAFFILENNKNPDLQGTVIINSYNSGKEEYSLREVVK